MLQPLGGAHSPPRGLPEEPTVGAEWKGQQRQSGGGRKATLMRLRWQQPNPAGTQGGCGARGHGGQRPRLGAWSTCQRAPANFRLHGRGGQVLHERQNMCQVTLPRILPKGRKHTPRGFISAAAAKEDSESLTRARQASAGLSHVLPLTLTLDSPVS